MSSTIRTNAEFSIQEGKVDDFKALVSTMIEMTDANEANTLTYEWYISEDGSKCHLTETFKDSDAFLVHLGNVSDKFDTLFALAPMTEFQIYGSPSAELQQTLDTLDGVQYYPYFDGVTR